MTTMTVSKSIDTTDQDAVLQQLEEQVLNELQQEYGEGSTQFTPDTLEKVDWVMSKIRVAVERMNESQMLYQKKVDIANRAHKQLLEKLESDYRHNKSAWEKQVAFMWHKYGDQIQAFVKSRLKKNVKSEKIAGFQIGSSKEPGGLLVKDTTKLKLWALHNMFDKINVTLPARTVVDSAEDLIDLAECYEGDVSTWIPNVNANDIKKFWDENKTANEEGEIIIPDGMIYKEASEKPVLKFGKLDILAIIGGKPTDDEPGEKTEQRAPF